jgi:hypothetical protein
MEEMGKRWPFVPQSVGKKGRHDAEGAKTTRGCEVMEGGKRRDQKNRAVMAT